MKTKLTIIICLMLVAQIAAAQVLFQDNFSGTLNPTWSFVRQDASYYSLQSTGLVLRCNSGDLYQGNNNAKNVFLITNPAPGDFTITIRLRWLVPPAQAYAQVDLLAYDDDDNHVRPQYVYSTTGIGIANAFEVGGSYSSSVLTGVDFGTNRFWLQMQKAGLTCSIWYSTNGVSFLPASAAFSYANPHPAKLGFVAMVDPTESATVFIDSFMVAAGTPNAALAGVQGFIPVNLAPVANALNGRLTGCPTGAQLLGGVPFQLLPLTNNCAWDGIVGTVVGQLSTNIMNLPVNIPNATAVDTLINLSWGYGGQPPTLAFICADGFTYTQELVPGDDVRDWLEGAYINTANDTNTIQVYSAPAVNYSGHTGRIDKQHIQLPAAFASRTLTSIVLTDAGVTGNDDVGYSQSVHAQRVFIYGVTVTSLLNLQARPSGNHVQLSWPANAGTIYQLQSTTNLSAASWINEGAAVNGSGGVMTTNIPVSSAAQKFFRLQLLNN
jgi:hypothetical protein